MKVNFVDNINEHGESMVRLYNFPSSEAQLFYNALAAFIQDGTQPLYLETLDFVEVENHKLVLVITEEDHGIESPDKINFYCGLTKPAFEKMLKLIEPFNHKESVGFQNLYDADCLTDLLYVPSAT